MQYKLIYVFNKILGNIQLIVRVLAVFIILLPCHSIFAQKFYYAEEYNLEDWSKAQAERDRRALMDLYYATDGPNWRNNYGWGTDLPIGQWYGVGTNLNGFVTWLELTANNLCGTIPESIGDLVGLSWLFLDQNKLTDSIPISIGNLVCLEYFNISMNQLTGTIPSSIGNLKMLRDLSLSNNYLSGAIPVDMCHLPELSSLSLSGNRLTGNIPKELGGLKNIQYIGLSSNPLTGKIPESLRKLNLSAFSCNNCCLDLSDQAEWVNDNRCINWHTTDQLEPFSLEEERLALEKIIYSLGLPEWNDVTGWQTDLPINRWSRIGKIIGSVTSIMLSGIYANGVIPESIGRLKNLKEILINNDNSEFQTVINGSLPDSIGCCTHLKKLQIMDNQIIGPIPASIGNLLELEVLALDNNDITGTIPESMANLTKLQRLGLGWNNLRGQIPAGILDIPQLNNFSVTRNSLDLSNVESHPRFSNLFHGGYLDQNLIQWNIYGRQPELEYLMSLYNATDGPNWTHNEGWGTDAPLEDWYGVTLSTSYDLYGRIAELRLNDNNLSGTIPEGFEALDHLEWLDLSSNNLYGTIPDSLVALEYLEWLNLSYNRLTGIIPTNIGQYPSLWRLYLDGNQLEGTLPESVNQLENTDRSYYSFTNNRLSGPLPDITNDAIINSWYYSIYDGNQFSITDLYGLRAPSFCTNYSENKLTALFQWSSTCSPAMAMMSRMIPLYDRYHSYGFEIFSWNDRSDSYDWIKWSNNWRECWLTGWAPQLLAYDQTGHLVYCSLLDSITPFDAFVESYLGPAPMPTPYASTDYSKDGMWSKLNSCSGIPEGSFPCNLVIMGDGFSDRQVESGFYASIMRQAAEAVFNEEPLKSLRNYFQVYSVNVVSEHEGLSGGETALGGWFGEGTHVGGDNAKVLEYAQKVVSTQSMDRTTIVVVINDPSHHGTCYYYLPEAIQDGGTAIAYLSAGLTKSQFNYIVGHEVGGHGIGKLGDEYSYDYNPMIPELEVTEYRYESSMYGWWGNVDFTDNPADVKWNRFIDDKQYANEGIGVYKGACTYMNGAWRSTENSIMRDNLTGFNAPSRMAIWKSVMKVVYGIKADTSYEEFLKFDIASRSLKAPDRRTMELEKQPATREGSEQISFEMLHPPVIIYENWKETTKRTQP